MSGFPQKPPTTQSPIFNPTFYQSTEIDLDLLNLIYVRKDDPSNTALSGITLGAISPNKVITADSSSRINSVITTTNAFRVERSTSAFVFESIIGSSTFSIFHQSSSGAAFIGTTTEHPVIFQMGGVERWRISAPDGHLVSNGQVILGGHQFGQLQASYLTSLSRGVCMAEKALVVNASRNISNINELRGSFIGIGDALPTTLTQDLSIMESASTPSIRLGRLESNNNAFNINYVHNSNGSVLNRLTIEPFGGTTSSSIHITANGRLGVGSASPTQPLEVLGNINISSGSSYMIGGTSIDSRYLRADADTTATSLVRFYSSQAAGAADQQLIRLGHATDSGDWFLRHHRSSGGAANNCLELLNTNSNLLGISIGTFNGTSVGDGCMAVFNGIQGDSNFIRASSVNCNGALHLNAGIPQSVSAGWTFDSTGNRSNTGGTVSVSLYAYNNIWVRGALYATSDRRLKNVHTPIDSAKAMKLLNITPKWYSWKRDTNGVAQLGLIAQDLLENDLQELTHLFHNEEVKEADHEHNIPEKKQLVVAYDRLPLYLLEIIKKQAKDIAAGKDQLFSQQKQIDDLVAEVKLLKEESSLQKSFQEFMNSEANWSE